MPDENLGAWVIEQTGRDMQLWRGNCYAHVEFTHESITPLIPTMVITGTNQAMTTFVGSNDIPLQFLIWIFSVPVSFR